MSAVRERGDRTIAEPRYCACGCGEVVNRRQIDAQRRRSNGWTISEIAAEWMVTPTAVKAHLYKTGARFKVGHSTLAHGSAREQICERCGKSMLRSTPTRFCGSYRCQAQSLDGFSGRLYASMVERIDRNRDVQRQRLAEFFTGERQRKERRERRRRYRSPEFQAFLAEKGRRAREADDQSARAWLAQQSDEVRELVENDSLPPAAWFSLDAVIAGTDRLTLRDRIPVDYNPRSGAEWHDPVAEAAIERASVGEEVATWDLLA